MSVKVSLDARTLDRALSSLVEGALREIGATLVDIADDAEANAEDKWYTQVRRRTGRTGTALDTELRAKQEQLQAVVLSRNKASYVVRRPGPLSVITQLLSASEYAEAMSQYRRTGALPPDVKVQKVNSNGQPIGLYRTRRNPLASDGKVLWQELVRKEGRKIVLARVRDVDAALQRAADHMSRG